MPSAAIRYGLSPSSGCATAPSRLTATGRPAGKAPPETVAAAGPLTSLLPCSGRTRWPRRRRPARSPARSLVLVKPARQVGLVVIDQVEGISRTAEQRARPGTMAEEHALAGGDHPDRQVAVPVAAAVPVVLAGECDDVADAQILQAQRQLTAQARIRAHQVGIGVLRDHSDAGADGARGHAGRDMDH